IGELLERTLEHRRRVLRKETPPAAPGLRLRIDGETVYLDGQVVTLGLTVEAAIDARTFLEALIQYAPERVSMREIGRGKRWDRVRKKLPAALRALIESGPKGYRIALAHPDMIGP